MKDDTKNLILAIGVSLLILMVWPFVHTALFPPPPAPPPGAQTDQVAPQTGDAGQSGVTSVSSSGVDHAGVPVIEGAPVSTAAVVSLGRQEALGQNPRIAIETPRLSGSLNLKGARLDDITLKGYREELDQNSQLIDLLHPSGSANPYLVQFGWAGVGDVETPSGETVWTADGASLTPQSPVTLRWTNANGVLFEQIFAIDDNYMLTVSQSVTNGSTEDVGLAPYGRIFRSGTPEVEGFYILHEGLIGVFNEILEERDYSDLEDKPSESFATQGGWMGITDKYWLVALVPNQHTPVESTFLRTPSGFDAQYHVNFAEEAQIIAPGARADSTNHAFIGAKETVLLDSYAETLGVRNFDLAVDFGWFYFLTKPIFLAIHWLASPDVLDNFGLAILVLTVGIKLVFFPLANKSYRSMSKMKLLQPKIVEMRERCGDDKQKMQQEMMELYKKEKVNPLSGCLPILIQIPVFFALYKVLFVTIEMRHAPFFGWIDDLSAPDPLGILTGFGLIDWQVPAFLALFNIGLWPILMGLSMWAQQKLNPPPADPIQQKIFALMPIFFTFILGGFPAGLVIYWAWNNTLSILQQYVIMRRMGVAIGGGKIDDQGKD